MQSYTKIHQNTPKYTKIQQNIFFKNITSTLFRLTPGRGAGVSFLFPPNMLARDSLFAGRKIQVLDLCPNL